MLSRSHDSTIDLDLDLAAKQDPENPVYYVQMMHARIAGDLPPAPRGPGGRGARAPTRAGVALNDAERELIRKVLAFPDEVREAVERRAPHRIASYALELGQAFAAFYRDSPVRDEPDEALQSLPDRALASQRDARSPQRLRCSACPPRSRCDATVVTRSRPRPYIHADNRGLVAAATGRSACSSRRRSCARARRRSRSSPARAARRAAQAPARRRRLQARRESSSTPARRTRCSR